MSTTPHIVVVDDEPDLRETLSEYLEMRGFRVSTAEDASALRALPIEAIDLAVLDINMPGEDGLSLARYLRESTQIAIVMLTAAGEMVDRVVGLEVGADDYLAKPVDPRELLARINAVLRRYQPERVVSSPADAPLVLDVGPCRLDLDAHTLSDANGDPIPITALEFELLRVFAERPHRVLDRDQLFRLVHDREWDPFDRSIDLRVSRLRRKVEPDPARPRVIKTVHGVGYVYAPGDAYN